MADSFKAKQITSLTENTSMADTDIVPVGNAGTSTLRRIKWANILSAIKNKITSWTYNFNTSSKTLEGAVNEMQGNISAINGSLTTEKNRLLFKSHYVTGTGTFVYFVDPPAAGYIPVSATNGDWTANSNVKVTQVTRSNGACMVILDANLASGIPARIDILWAKQYD